MIFGQMPQQNAAKRHKSDFRTCRIGQIFLLLNPEQAECNMKEYKPRIADKLLEYRLEEVG